MRKLLFICFIHMGVILQLLSQDTLTYIKPGCLSSGTKGEVYQNGPPSKVSFRYVNDSLQIMGEIGANCGSSHLAIIENMRDTLFITTQDTGLMATCSCVFGFQISVKVMAEDSVVSFNGKIYHPNSYVGINENYLTGENDLEVFPNPVSTVVYIKAKGIEHMELINQQGCILKSNLGEEVKNSLDISAFQEGLYFLRIKTKEKVVVKTLIKSVGGRG